MAIKTLSNERINFATARNTIEYPDFLDIQVKSFKDFFQLETSAENKTKEGLYKVFAENFPITDSRENFDFQPEKSKNFSILY